MGVEVILGAIFLASTAISYVGMQKAKKLNQQTVQRTRGTTAQIRASAVPRRLVFGRTVVGGIDAFFNVSGDENEYLHFVEIWCDGPVKEIRNLLLDGVAVEMTDLGGGIFVPVTGSKYEGLIRWESELGTLDQPPRGQGIVPGWTATDLMVGIAYSWIELKYDPDVFSSGQPELSAEIVGQADIYDPRTDTTDWSDNPALCCVRYLTLLKRGPGVSYANKIAEAELITCANDCDDLMDLSADTGGDVTGSEILEAGVEKRYTFNGVVSLDMDPESIIEMFRMAMAGSIVYINGRWKLYAGVYQVPTFIITEDMLVGRIKKKNRRGRRDRFNTVRGVYRSEKTNWEPKGIPPYSKQEFIDADKGEILDEDLDLSFVNSIPRCRRISKITLLRSRYERSLTLTLDIRGYRAQSAKTVLVNLPNHGYDMMPADVLGVDFSIKNHKVEISLTLQETSPDIYDWDATGSGGGGDQDSDFADDDTNLTTFVQPDAPTGDSSGKDPIEYPDLFPIVDVPRTVYCKTIEGVAEICGFETFTAFDPPKRMLTRTIGGTVIQCTHGSPFGDCDAEACDPDPVGTGLSATAAVSGGVMTGNIEVVSVTDIGSNYRIRFRTWGTTDAPGTSTFQVLFGSTVIVSTFDASWDYEFNHDVLQATALAGVYVIATANAGGGGAVDDADTFVFCIPTNNPSSIRYTYSGTQTYDPTSSTACVSLATDTMSRKTTTSDDSCEPLLTGGTDESINSAFLPALTGLVNDVVVSDPLTKIQTSNGACISDVSVTECTRFEQLSNEYTEQMAVDDLLETLPTLEETEYGLCNGDNTLPCCISEWGFRGPTELDFPVKKSKFKVVFEGLNAAGFCIVDLQLYKVDLETSIPSRSDRVTFETYADGAGEVEFEYEIPLIPSHTHFVGTCRIRALSSS